jgi:hypothetical protein
MTLENMKGPRQADISPPKQVKTGKYIYQLVKQKSNTLRGRTQETSYTFLSTHVTKLLAGVLL